MKAIDISWEPDGLFALPVGPWAEDKYRLLSAYMQMFATGMRDKWNKRVFIDLYSGPGSAIVRDSGKWLKGSPLLALSSKNPFDKYIFCDEDESSITALEKRIEKHFSGNDVTLVRGDCHNKIQDVMSAIPSHSRNQTVLSFCFVDPFSLNLQFDTIRQLASKFVDFLILLALDMDGRRNVKHYIKETNIKVDRFLGLNDWRKRWCEFSQVDNNFQRFLADEFEKQMISLGYHKHKKANTRHITTSDKNLPLYHLAFFSRNSLGYSYWDECLKYSSNQIPFEF